VVGVDQALGLEPRGLRRLVHARDRVAVAGEGIGDRIEREDGGHRVVAARVEGAVRPHDRHAGVLAPAHGRKQRELPAARAAHEPHAPRIDAEPRGVRTHPAHTGRDVGAGGRVLVLGALPEAEGDDDEAARGQRAAVQGARRVIAPAPGTAVHLDERGERRGRLPARLVDAGQQREVRGAGERHV
jgi:hypothetical protein